MDCCHRTKERSAEEMTALINRLSRIEGQVRGLRRMVEENAYCPDILTQTAAANAALQAFGQQLLEAHIRTCVAQDLAAGQTETVDELMDTLRKFMK
jgi:DNA-binding FrmR family transcriptional regulator